MMIMAFPIQSAVTARNAIRPAPMRTAWTVSAVVSEVLMKTSSQRTRPPQVKAKKRMNSRMQR